MEGQDFTNLLIMIQNIKQELHDLEYAIKTSIEVKIVKGE